MQMWFGTLKFEVEQPFSRIGGRKYDLQTPSKGKPSWKDVLTDEVHKRARAPGDWLCRITPR